MQTEVMPVNDDDPIVPNKRKSISQLFQSMSFRRASSTTPPQKNTTEQAKSVEPKKRSQSLSRIFGKSSS